MKAYEQEYEANEVICREGDPSTDLYYVQSGKLLVCTIQGTQVKAIATIEAGEFIGELSFFDGKARSTNIIALEKSTLVQIPKGELENLLPEWYLSVGKNITKKIRILDQVIHDSRIRRFGGSDQKALTIEEQRRFYAAITQQES